MQSNTSTPKNDVLDKMKELGISLPYSSDSAVLATEFSINSKTAPNRIVCQAMEGCDGTLSGTPGELTERRYKRLAEGGAGIIWFEATAVMAEGRANPRQLFITEENLDAFKRQVDVIKEAAVKKNSKVPLVFMQATHSGRYSKPEGVPAPLIAYNCQPIEATNPISEERIVTDEYLDRVGENLVNGAVLAQKAGFDGVDIKCCHRYLNSELLSAYNRKGHYGGSFENRTRLLRESVRGAIEICSDDFTVTSRLNIYDGLPYPFGFGTSADGSGGVDLSEPIKLARELYSYGVRLLNITMGNPYFNPHINRPFFAGGYKPDEHPFIGVARMLESTAELKKALPEMALICSALSCLGTAAPNIAAGFIESGGFDFAGFGRMILAYPDFANDIMHKGELVKDKCCICCSKCTEIMRKPGGTPGCVIRDKEVYMPIYKELCGGDRK